MIKKNYLKLLIGICMATNLECVYLQEVKKV